MGYSRSRNGQSVIEVLIAIALLATMSVASFILLNSTFSEGLVASGRARAERTLENGVEAVRQIRNASFEDLTVGTHGLIASGGTWTFSGTEDVTDSTYHRSVSIASIDDATREITITVTWTNQQGRTETRSSVTRFTDWETPIIPTASNCYGYAVSGDWRHPVVLGSADIGAGNQGTDVVVDLPYVYVSGVASTSSKHDLFVFDVSNPASPTLVKSLDVGSGGISSLSLSGNYLYAASANDNQEFMVFDVTDPTHASRIALTNPSGSADGLSVIAKGDLVAIGRATSSSAEIYFYDMTTKTVPSLLTTVQIAGDVNDFATSENDIFAVSSAVSADLTTFDVTDPLHPTTVSTYDLRDGTQDISLAYQDPGVLFVGNVDDEFISVNVADPLHPVPNSPVATGGQVKDMVCTNDERLFIGTDNSTKEFMVLDITNLNAIAEYASLNFPQVVTGIDFASNMVFASVRSNDALRIITSSP